MARWSRMGSTPGRWGCRWCGQCICISSIASDKSALSLLLKVFIDSAHERARCHFRFENSFLVLQGLDSNLPAWLLRIGTGQWLWIASSLSLEGHFFLSEACRHHWPGWQLGRVWGRAEFLDCWFANTSASICLAISPALTRQDWAVPGDFGISTRIQSLGIQRRRHLGAHWRCLGLWVERINCWSSTFTTCE